MLAFHDPNEWLNGLGQLWMPQSYCSCHYLSNEGFNDLTIAKYVVRLGFHVKIFMYVGHLQTLVGMRTYVDEFDEVGYVCVSQLSLVN